MIPERGERLSSVLLEVDSLLELMDWEFFERHGMLAGGMPGRSI
jgi:hypothetical protein